MKLHIITNYTQKFIDIILRFIMIPIYVESLGLASYGLIGIYTALNSIMVFLDFGMGYGSMKLIAEKSNEDILNEIPTLRAIEKIYLSVSFIIGISVMASSELIAYNWLDIDDITINGGKVIFIMGILLGVSWPQSLYQSFLAGQKRFVVMSILLSLVNIFNSIALFYFMAIEDRGIDYFFYIMIIFMFLQTILLRYLAWQKLPLIKKKVNFNSLKNFFKYSGPVSLFSISSLVFFQTPILFITTFATVSELGIYNLGLVFPMAIMTSIHPITSVAFPNLVNINSKGPSFSIFKNLTALMTIIIIISSFLLFVNMDYAYKTWLNIDVQNLSRVIDISRNIVMGVSFYILFMVLSTTLLANDKPLSLVKGFCITLFVMISALAFNHSHIDALITSQIWSVSTFILTICTGILFHKQFSELSILWFKEILKHLVLIIPIIFLYFVLKYFFLADGFYLLIGSCFISFLICLYPLFKVLKKL